ncbi:MAG: histidine kinase, partial [Xanthobacteraceae bacterium]
MPSLFRFLVFVGILSGMIYGAMFSLARYVKPTPREITVTISPDKF